MAVTLLHTPGEISFSKNPMVFEFESDRYLADTGSVYVGYIYFFNDTNPSFVGPVENAVLVLKMYNTTEVFTFKNGAIGDNNELPTKLTSETVPQWIDRVILAFRKNFTLNNYYQLSQTPGVDLGGSYMVIGDSNHYIEFKGIQLDARSNMELTNESVTMAGQAIVFQARNTVYEVNLRIYVELWVKVNTDYKKLIGSSLPTDNRGKAKWDISIPLTDHLLLNKTSISELSGTINPNDICSYYLRYTEIYGDNLATGDYNQTSVSHALFGGQTTLNYLNGGISLLKNGIQSSWLTHLLSGKALIGLNQLQWLSWVNFALSSIDIVVKAKVNYANGTYWVFTLYAGAIQAYEKLTFPISFWDVDRTLLFPGQKVISYSVSIESESGRLSPDMTYIVNNTSLPFEKVWAYRNSYGCFETLTTSGAKTYSYDLDTYSAEIISNYDQGSNRERIIDYDVQMHDKVKVYSGYKAKADIEQFRDFFLSTEKYIYKNDSWIPVNIESSTIEEYTDGNMLHGISFDVRMQEKYNLWGR